MRQMVIPVLAGALMAVLGTTALADPVNSRDAKKQLFKGNGFTVEMLKGAQVGAVTLAQVEALVAAMQSPDGAAALRAQGFSLDYYGAIAVVPDRALSQKTMAVSDELHSPAMAQAVAIGTCNRARPNGATACIAVAMILPAKYKSRDFSLNQHATSEFLSGWKSGKGPKYLAYSPTSNAWAIAKGDGAGVEALAECNAAADKVGTADCVIGIADD